MLWDHCRMSSISLRRPWMNSARELFPAQLRSKLLQLNLKSSQSTFLQLKTSHSQWKCLLLCRLKQFHPIIRIDLAHISSLKVSQTNQMHERHVFTQQQLANDSGVRTKLSISRLNLDLEFRLSKSCCRKHPIMNPTSSLYSTAIKWASSAT